MADKNGAPIYCGDKVRGPNGKTFHIHGWNPATGAKEVAFSHDVELVEASAKRGPVVEGSIVWGNGPKLE